MQENKRRNERYLLPGGIQVNDEHQRYPFEISDISAGGVCMHCDRCLQLGTPISFHFDYYDFEFPLKGEIKWTMQSEDGGWRHGVSFDELSLAHRIVLEAYVNKLSYLREQQKLDN